MAGKHRFVFVCRGPLVFVAVTRSKLSESQVIYVYFTEINTVYFYQDTLIGGPDPRNVYMYTYINF